MPPTPIFAVPALTQSHISKPKNTSRKRKRHNQRTVSQDETVTAETRVPEDEHGEQDIEYTAVLTPSERQQRRLAGHPLDTNPPNFPFPHAPELSSQKRLQNRFVIPEVNSSGSISVRPNSLRAQHLATITSVVHRCLRDKDYTRAGRALGLLLRSEINGKQIDIRDEGMWGIGAEILLQQSRLYGSAISREGWERVKIFYDNLTLHYPPTKPHPEAVNAEDFKLALFGVWIFVTVQESLSMQTSEENVQETSSEVGSEAKMWEMHQAEQIATQMDTLMNTAPYSDNAELIRLRGMVGLWLADLIEECEGTLMASTDLDPQHGENLSFIQHIGLDSNHTDSSQARWEKANEARALAKRLLAKLETGTGQDEDLVETED